MMYYDRFTGKMTADLPSGIDLGRFAVIENNVILDLTNKDVIKLGDYIIRESITKESHVHELLDTIAASYRQHIQSVIPIVQKFDIEIHEFEKLLIEHKSHLAAIVSNPHSLLDKNTTKVNIGRAKRISTKSYQHLAHHSEDWEKMSVISPKPRKILHEELTINLAVYENLLLKSFLHETIKHLNKRIKTTADIFKFFLSIFDPKEFENVFAEKIDRSNALVGRACKSDKSNETSATNRALAALKSEVAKFEHSPMFQEFPKHSVASVTYHDTNVLNSHKHYKYLKILWMALMKAKGQNGKDGPVVDLQNIMNDLRVYVQSLFIYTLGQMNYEITGVPDSVTATHENLPAIHITSDKYGVLNISTDNSYYRIIILGGVYDLMQTQKLPEDTVCFCYKDYQEEQENLPKLYFVNPFDTNSIECAGQIIRKLIIQEYIKRVDETYTFRHSLRDFVSAIECKEIIFDRSAFTYSFQKHLPKEIDPSKVIDNLRQITGFKLRNRRDQDILINDITELVNDINNNITRILYALACPKCGKLYKSQDIRYLVCGCDFICDLTKAKLYHRYKSDIYKDITVKGWGMDSVE